MIPPDDPGAAPVEPVIPPVDPGAALWLVELVTWPVDPPTALVDLATPLADEDRLVAVFPSLASDPGWGA